MSGPTRVWASFAVAVAVVVAGMGWVTWTAWSAEAARVEARRDAQLEEQVRLALWRMDATVAPILASDARGEFLLLAFTVGADGSVEAAEGGAEAETRLAALRELLDPAALRAAVPAPGRAPTSPVRVADARSKGSPLNLAPQQARNDAEWTRRASNAVQSASIYANNYRLQDANEVGAARGAEVAPVLGGARLLWHRGALILAARGETEAGEVLEGRWIDWDALREALLTSVADLLPEAGLTPLPEPSGTDTSRRLAALDARLDPGRIPFASSGEGPLVASSLLLAWLGVLLAAVAVGWLMQGTLALSERRGAFVSAVTHELRTPLTTFRMYTEMLASGMVTDEAARDRYVGTLHAEAERLGHLVENVLAWSRLERRNTAAHLESVSVGELVGRCADRLVQRAEQAEMVLSVDPGEAVDLCVRVDVGAIERVLFNLVDNACKYAGAAEDRRIALTADARGRGVRLTVRDHGPGIAADVAPRLFQPFAKTDKEAARTAPGVGLGLALSRGLARGMGGELRASEAPGGGARFELDLPGA